MGPYSAKIVFYQSIILMFGLLCLQLSMPMSSDGADSGNAHRLKTIVIDPGHGGADYGARGADGTLEKQIVLALSKLIAKGLETEYRVLLTRSADQDLPLAERTALANHHKAVLFISIHLGAAFRSDISGSHIMSYNALRSENREPLTEMVDIADNGHAPSGLWEKNQLDHVSTSRRMAERLRLELKNSGTSSLSPTYDHTNLYVLSGATMPALYLEPFYLTHPETEKYYQNTGNLEQLADELATGIRTTLKKEKL